MRIGAHVSSAGGVSRAFARAEGIGAEAIQIFLSAPRRWKPPAIGPEEARAFRRLREERGLPVFAHAIYLVNLASAEEALVQRSVDSLVSSLATCGELGIAGLIFHVGSHTGKGFEAVLPTVIEAVRRVLAEAPGEARLVLENSAGQGGGVGCTWSELGAILRGADAHPRLAICLDTCHALATGYELRTPQGLADALADFEKEIGLDRLVAVHANDSKTPLGGLRDRHENVGDGHIGVEGFANILGHPALRDRVFLLEVPGLEGHGPDAENLRRLKEIRSRLGLPQG